MFKIEKSGSANSIMHDEAVAGRYGIRCFDYFGQDEDAIVIYPTWERVEHFISNNSNHPELFEILIGTEFDLGIDDAVLVIFSDGDERRVLCSKNAYEQRVRKLEAKRAVADG